MSEANDAAVLRILREIGEDSGLELSTRLQLDSIQALRVRIQLEKHFDLEIDEEQIFDGWFDTDALTCWHMTKLASGTPAATLPLRLQHRASTWPFVSSM